MNKKQGYNLPKDLRVTLISDKHFDSLRRGAVLLGSHLTKIKKPPIDVWEMENDNLYLGYKDNPREFRINIFGDILTQDGTDITAIGPFKVYFGIANHRYVKPSPEWRTHFG